MESQAISIERIVKLEREKRLRALSSKELRKVMYKSLAGLSPMGRHTAKQDAIVAKEILAKRKNKSR